MDSLQDVSNNVNDNKEITFENFCDKYKIIYSIKPYTFDTKRNVIKIPQRTIHSNCIISVGNCLMAEKILNKPLSDEMINYLTTFSGHNINTNNLIEKVYNYINKFLPDTYLIVIITYYQIYFQLIDKLFEKYVLLQNKAYTTSMLFCFHYDKLNNNKLMFEHESKEYEFNDDNLSKIIKLYKKKYTINQRIQNMYYTSFDNDSYYVKSGSFGDKIFELNIKTNDLENVYIEFNKKIVNINKLDWIIQRFNSCKR